MAQKLLKVTKSKIAPKKSAVVEPSIVLVGTYKEKQLAWIKKHGVYNYPIKEEDGLKPESCAKVKELWLYASAKGKRYCFAAEFAGIQSKDEFLAANPTYKNLGQSKHARYMVFKTSVLDYGPRLDGATVFARVSDFEKGRGRTKKIAAAIKQFHADGDFGLLADYLPNDLAKLPREQLRVCEAAVQLDFFPKMLKPIDAMKIKVKPKFTFIDLFAGCGGLSLGLERAGFTPLLVNELNPDALSTYLLNRRDEFPWLCDNNVSNVKDLVLNEKLLDGFHASIKKDFGIDIYKGQLDLICGGPPCQGFSGLGIRRSYSVEKKQLPSNYLYQDMAFLINRIRPKIFLFENVRGLLSAKWTNDGEKGEIFKDVLQTFKDIGVYHIRFKLVHAKDYGVPQNRPRILIVGLRKDVFPEPKVESDDAVLAGFLPKPVGGYPSIEELLGDLMDLNYQRGSTTVTYPRAPQNDCQKRLRTKRDGSVYKTGDPITEMEYSNHSDFIVEKFTAMIENGGEIPERFRTKKFAQKVLPRTWGKDGPTITACSAPDDYVHFAQPRSLTVREWARLQTFPDWYIFAGKRTTGGLRRAGNPREGIFDRELPKYTQIGNAVPVELAYNIGRNFVQLLEGVQC
ncbi:MAG: DNA cytosine methyltransferase [Kiritimatiellae bacterium]|nr:DNA cytosine methyltransferase [Kiritimatiellia bacterium]